MIMRASRAEGEALAQPDPYQYANVSKGMGALGQYDAATAAI
jgi:hypothetical protein